MSQQQQQQQQQQLQETCQPRHTSYEGQADSVEHNDRDGDAVGGVAATENDCVIVIDNDDHDDANSSHDQRHGGNSDDNDTINVMIPDGEMLADALESSASQSQSSSNELEVGDHVYQWRKLGFIPYVFQHHGIVMDVHKDHDGKVTKLVIADFSNVEPASKAAKHRAREGNKNQANTNKTASTTAALSSDEDEEEKKEKEESCPTSSKSNDSAVTGSTANTTTTTTTTRPGTTITSRRRRSAMSLVQEGAFRTYTDTDRWHKVEYGASWLNRQIYRSGTVTKAQAGPVGLILARVHFILEHPELLPDYHVIHANCECVAFWCRTGVWSSLQGSTFLELTTAGQVKSSVTLATAAATAQATVTVPSAGLWGWFGYTTTTTVSWLSLHPMAIPGIACYAALTIGVPAVYYASAHTAWKKTSARLNDAFWEKALDRPEVFAECVTHWSDKNS
jgi:hypothetical protein